MNIIAASFIAIGTVFDSFVWFYVKDLNMFDDEVKDVEMKDLKKENAADDDK